MKEVEKAPATGSGRWLSQAALLACLLALEVLTHLPVQLPPTLNIWDKAQHFAAFAVLSAWACLLWGWRPASLLLVAIGAQIEITQSLLSYRSAEWLDFLADLLGTAAGVGAVQAWRAAGGLNHASHG